MRVFAPADGRFGSGALARAGAGFAPYALLLGLAVFAAGLAVFLALVSRPGPR